MSLNIHHKKDIIVFFRHSSIDLYSINGTKINGPLELTNGAAYVAVEPPESFIDTGYEEYLLKASRSWEKRVAQKSYNTETTDLDGIRVKEPTVQINTENLNESESVAAAASIKVGNNVITSPQKPRPNKPYQRPQRKSITSPKQIQKNKCDSHTMAKKLCAETDKFVLYPKKIPVKKYVCVNQKTSTIVPCAHIETISKVPPWSHKRQNSTKPDQNSPENKTEAETNLVACNRTPNNEELLIDLFSNTKCELMSFNPDDHPIMDEQQNNLNEGNATVPNEVTCKMHTNNLQDFEKDSSNITTQMNEFDKSNLSQINLKSGLQNELGDNIPIIKNNNENKSNIALLQSRSEKQVIDEYVAQMNKGGLLLLKLKVKLKDCKTIFNRDKTKIVPMATSLSNLPKTEKTSQVDINISFSGELLKSNDQQNVQDKSLQSLLNKIYAEEPDQRNNKNPQIIVIQCACRDYSNINKCCMCDLSRIHSSKIESTQYATSLIQKLNETFTSCECQNESSKPSKDKSSLYDMVTQTEKDVDKMLVTNGTRVKDLAQKFEISDKGMSIDKCTYRDNNQNNDNNTINKGNQRLTMVLPRLLGSESQVTTENQLGEGILVRNIKTCYDKSTQTDWCNVVLEVRQHEGNNYTFHLPSLCILKQHNL